MQCIQGGQDYARNIIRHQQAITKCVSTDCTTTALLPIIAGCQLSPDRIQVDITSPK